MKLVVATYNPNKLNELKRMLPGHLELLPLSQYTSHQADETATTFVENALIKARFASQHSGLPAIADDSGLCVDALKGAPGVYSSHYSLLDDGLGYHYNQEFDRDTNNNKKLLAALNGLPSLQRGASFYCILVYIRHPEDGAPLIASGRWQGMIASQLKGDQGFGYDPLFWVPESSCHAAELTVQKKSAISHRGLAMRALLAQWN